MSRSSTPDWVQLNVKHHKKPPKLHFASSKLTLENIQRSILDSSCRERFRMERLVRIRFWVLTIVHHFKLSVTIERKSKETSYRTVSNYSDVAFCEIIAGNGKHIFMESVLNSYFKQAGDILEACTRNGEFKVSNLTFINSTFHRIWPDGDYKTAVKFFDVTDANILTVSYSEFIHHWHLRRKFE